LVRLGRWERTAKTQVGFQNAYGVIVLATLRGQAPHEKKGAGEIIERGWYGLSKKVRITF